jgi:hypothetical protein
MIIGSLVGFAIGAQYTFYQMDAQAKALRVRVENLEIRTGMVPGPVTGSRR